MKTREQHLEELRLLKRRQHHPLIHKIHKTHAISKKTLFYVKEYGPHSHAMRTILRESIGILLFAAILSSVGGFTLEHIKIIFVSITPLVILLPTMNGLIGGFGTIIASRFSTMLHEGEVNKSWSTDKELRQLFAQILIVSMITACLSSAVALAVSAFSNYRVNAEIALKVFLIVITDTLLLVAILFLVSVLGGLYFFKKREDPNNFLIPATTAVADFGNMVLLTILVALFF
ncbi:MAG: magnesium transporter [Candidatus Diapherotrites archaeon]|nr:magnesium transporter [Candidatus Diapherotrites archaeon]